MAAIRTATRFIDLDDIVAQGGKVLTSQLPASVLGGMSYQGVWNASANSPALASGVGTKGFFYKVSVAGSTALDGIASWHVGDWAVYDGAAWEKVDNFEAVTTVAGRIGDIALAAGDVAGLGSAATHPASDFVSATAPQAANAALMGPASGAAAAPAYRAHVQSDLPAVVASAGTTPRSLAARFGEVYNAKNFGAVGDGVADDTVAVQAAIAAAAAAGGGVADLPAGTYLVSNQAPASNTFALQLLTGVTLRGAGLGSTTIRLADGQTKFTRTVLIQSVSKVTVRDLTIDGNTAGNPNGITSAKEQQHGIFVNASTDVSVVNCRITATSGDGMYWYANSVRPSAIGCTFDACSRCGIHAQTFSDGVVAGCHFANSPTNNHIKSELDNTGQGGSGLAITGNTFDGNATSFGVQLGGYLGGNVVPGAVGVTNGSAAVVGTGTNFLTTVAAGSSVSFSNEGVVRTVSAVADDTHLTLSAVYTGTTVASGVGLTVSVPGTAALTNGSTAVVGTGTHFLTAVQPGNLIQFTNDSLLVPYFVLSVADDTHLLLDAPYLGPTGSAVNAFPIPVSWTENVTIVGNAFRNLAAGVSIPSGTRNWTIAGNTFQNCAAAVQNASTNGAYGLSGTRNIVVVGNTVTGATGAGAVSPIQLGNTTGALISDNVIDGPLVQYAIQVVMCDGVVLSGNVVTVIPAGFAVQVYRSRNVAIDGLLVRCGAPRSGVYVNDDVNWPAANILVDNLTLTGTPTRGAVEANDLVAAVVKIGSVNSPGPRTYGTQWVNLDPQTDPSWHGGAETITSSGAGLIDFLTGSGTLRGRFGPNGLAVGSVVPGASNYGLDVYRTGVSGGLAQAATFVNATARATNNAAQVMLADNADFLAAVRGTSNGATTATPTTVSLLAHDGATGLVPAFSATPTLATLPAAVLINDTLTVTPAATNHTPVNVNVATGQSVDIVRLKRNGVNVFLVQYDGTLETDTIAGITTLNVTLLGALPDGDGLRTIGSSSKRYARVAAVDVIATTISMNNIGGSLPAASAGLRGQRVYLYGGVGVADAEYVCQKSAADTYAWVAK